MWLLLGVPGGEGWVVGRRVGRRHCLPGLPDWEGNEANMNEMDTSTRKGIVVFFYGSTQLLAVDPNR